MRQLGDDPDALMWTIPQVARSLGIGRNKVYQLIYMEGLPVHRFGRAVRISKTALQRWLQQREQQKDTVG
jgi:excisionase family DNA binding protein